MSTRRELLFELFRRLAERQIPCCVQRNYANLFDDPASDVDLLTLPARVNDVIACCEAAAKTTGQQLVQRTRFVNHSLVLWNGGKGFLRIDVDTEKRWRRFHLLTAAQILQQRRWLGQNNKTDGRAGGPLPAAGSQAKDGAHGVAGPAGESNFCIPDPRHEAVILLTQALWQEELSERYAARLRQFDQQVADKDSLAAVFGEAFGLRENLLANLADAALPERLRRAVRRSVCLQPARALRSLGYLLGDALRLLARLKSPPGISVRTTGVSDAGVNELRARLAILFPMKKAFQSNGPVAKSAIRKTLFKGGLLIEAQTEAEKSTKLDHGSWFEPSRSFAVIQEPDGAARVLHVGTGIIHSLPATARPEEVASGIADFICRVLARQLDK